jgi:hypothetical protein
MLPRRRGIASEPRAATSASERGSSNRPAPPPGRALLRLDWRWLLPDRRPATALCLDDGELRAAVEAADNVVAGAVAYGDVEGQTVRYQLVIATRLDPEMLRRAHGLLSDEGVFYGEAPQGVRPQRVVADLRRAGYGSLQIVFPWPSPKAPKVWVPIYPPAAASRHFCRSIQSRLGIRSGGS